MASFLQVLRRSLRYRWTIAAALFSSLMVGVLWGLNIATVYPIVQVVFDGTTVHQSLEKKVAALTQEIADLRAEQQANEVPAIATKLEVAERSLAVTTSLQPWADRFIPDSAFQTLVLVFGLVMLGTVLKGAFMLASTFAVGRLTRLTIFDLRNEYFRRVLKMDLKIFDQDRSSGLVSRCTYDFDRLTEGVSAVYGQGLREPVKMLCCLIGAALICWQLLVISLLLVPLGGFATRWVTRWMKQTTQKEMGIVHALYHRLDESFQGIKTVRVFGREHHERRRFFATGKEFVLQTRALIFVGMFKPVTEILGMAGVTLAVLTGSYLVLNQETHLFGLRICDRPMGPETLMLFYGFLIGMADPARKLSSIGGSVYAGVACAERILDFMQQKPDLVDPVAPVAIDNFRPDVDLSGVSFQYRPDQLVLRDINLKIPFGTSVAIVGPNGCGKSTLANLLTRLYDPLEGSVKVGSVDVRDARQSELRKLVGVVAQDLVLFDDTVADNIRFGRPDATDDEVIAAAKQAFIHDCIVNEMPNGYQTMVGQKGSRLSSGQRQRIALARVILRNPRILILDEATSHVDLESERLIHCALDGFLQNRTAILITHRPSALRLADWIVVMEQGRIIDTGTSAQLLSRCGVYQRLYQSELSEAA